MSWHDFAITHSDNSFWAHGNAQFYPYHRAMLWQFEQAIHSTGIYPATVGVPYFDWSAMSQNWWTSDIFTDTYFGAINNPADTVNHCVVTGAFKKGVYVVAPDAAGHRVVTGTDMTCLRRNAAQSALTDASIITKSFSATSYTMLTSDSAKNYFDETNYHADGHGVLGGPGSDMGNPSVPPNAPLFWLHHGFVDKYWWKWQNICPSYKMDYGGVLARADDPVSAGTNTATANLFVDSWPFTVSQLLNTQSGSPFCYTYSSSAGDLPPPAVTCPAFTPLSTSASPLPSTTAASATDTAAVALPSPTANLNDAVWLNKMLNTFINQKPLTFGTGSNAFANATDAGGDGSSGSLNGVAVFGRDSTEPPAESYTDVQNVDGSTTVSYVVSGYTVTIPAGFEIVMVNAGSVTAMSLAGKPTRFHPDLPLEAPYVPNGSGDHPPGSVPCLLAYPTKLSKSYIEGMGKSYTKYLNIHNNVLQKTDEYNADNCGLTSG
ncbi:hypothetical protein HDU98_004880 [Podochytrium sp. JEL0797]|nr:hypothetical protein HDU98_004880 [Podochytrium sp. JEL0797]